MIDFVAVISNTIAGVLIGAIVFLFTNSKQGIHIISRIKYGVDDSNDRKKQDNSTREEEESNKEGENNKKVSSKIYSEPKGNDVNTFYTIKSEDLERYDNIDFFIKNKVDRENVYFKINTEFLKSHTPEEYLKDSNKKIQVYIRRKEGKKDFNIERLGKTIEALSVTKYKKTWSGYTK